MNKINNNKIQKKNIFPSLINIFGLNTKTITYICKKHGFNFKFFIKKKNMDLFLEIKWDLFSNFIINYKLYFYIDNCFLKKVNLYSHNYRKINILKKKYYIFTLKKKLIYKKKKIYIYYLKTKFKLYKNIKKYNLSHLIKIEQKHINSNIKKKLKKKNTIENKKKKFLLHFEKIWKNKKKNSKIILKKNFTKKSNWKKK